MAKLKEGSVIKLNAGGEVQIATLNDLTTSSITGTLTPDKGGTGINSYTPNDMLYASGSTTLAKLTAPTAAAKYFLTSTGTGSASGAPTWLTISKSDVGLANVENTTLSTWAGTANITTLGTITTGTWHGSTIGTAYGGTGLTTYAAGDIIYASAANTLASLAKGTDNYVLTIDSTTHLPMWKTATAAQITGQITLANGGTGADMSNTTNYPTGSLVTIGTQGSNMGVLKPSATTGQLLVNNAGAAPSWSATILPTSGIVTGDLLLGTAANTMGRLAIGTNAYVLTSNGTTASWAALPASNLGSTGNGGVSGILPVPNGGTGVSSLTAHGVLIGEGTSAVNVTTAGTVGQVLASGGASADPAFSNTARITNLQDLNGVSYLTGTGTASAVNYVNITNTIAGTGPTINSVGSDTNIDLTLASKGTGRVKIDKATLTSAAVSLANDPSSNMDAATKQYVDNLAAGLDVRASVKATTTGSNIVLATGGLLIVDGYQTVAGDRILVKDQTAPAENGIYIVSAGAWTRSLDAATVSQLNPGMFTFVERGTTNSDSGWVLSSDAVVTLGTDPINFVQFSGAGSFLAGAGLTKVGNTFSHTDTSSVADLTSATNTFITAETYDTYGHVQTRTTGTVDFTVAANYGFKSASIDNTDTEYTWVATDATTVNASSNTDTVKFVAGKTGSTYGIQVKADSTNKAIAITHADTSALSGAYTGTGNAISSITVDEMGHVTAVGGSSTFLTASTGVTSFSGGTTGLTPNSATTGAVTLAGTLVVGNGGTGTSTAPNLNGVIYGASTSAYTSTAAGTTGQVLVVDGTGKPAFATLDMTYLPTSAFKQDVKAASTANLTVTATATTLTNAGAKAALTLDGIALVVNDRVLIKDQTTQAQNGVYIVTTVGDGSTNWVLTRSSACDSALEIAGAVVNIDSGTQGGFLWSNNFKSTDTLGTTAMPWYRVYSTFDSDVNATANKLVLRDGSGNINVAAITASGLASLNGGINCDSGKFTVADATGATYIDSTLNTKGAGTFQSTLGVTGATTLSSTLAVTGTGTFSSTLGVTGDFTVNTNKFTVTATNGNTSVAGTLGVTGAGTFSSTLGVTGNFAVNTNKFTVDASTGNTAVAGTLGVTGNTTLSGTLGVTGASTLTGLLNANGGINVNAGKFVVDTTGNTTALGTASAVGTQHIMKATSGTTEFKFVYNTTNDSLDLVFVA